MKIKRYICQYLQYVVVENAKGNFVSRRLYSMGDGKYYYTIDSKKVVVSEDDLNW